MTGTKSGLMDLECRAQKDILAFLSDLKAGAALSKPERIFKNADGEIWNDLLVNERKQVLVSKEIELRWDSEGDLLISWQAKY